MPLMNWTCLKSVILCPVQPQSILAFIVCEVCVVEGMNYYRLMHNRGHAIPPPPTRLITGMHQPVCNCTYQHPSAAGVDTMTTERKSPLEEVCIDFGKRYTFMSVYEI